MSFSVQPPSPVASTSQAKDDYFKTYSSIQDTSRRSTSKAQGKRRQRQEEPKPRERGSPARTQAVEPVSRKRANAPAHIITRLSAESIPNTNAGTSVSHGGLNKNSASIHSTVRSPASSRHSRAPSLSPSTVSPSTTNDSTSDSDVSASGDRLRLPRVHRFPFRVENIAFEDMDTLVSSLPKSPTRSGRSKTRSTRQKDRYAEQKQDNLGRQLKEKLKRLQHELPPAEAGDDQKLEAAAPPASVIDTFEDWSKTPSPSRKKRVSRTRSRQASLALANTPAPVVVKTPEKTVVPSIDEIVRKYTNSSIGSPSSSATVPMQESLSKTPEPVPIYGLGLTATDTKSARMSAPSSLQHTRQLSVDSSSSFDSVIEEALRSGQEASPIFKLNHARSLPQMQDLSASKLPASPNVTTVPSVSATDHEITTYLRSARLTRLLSLETGTSSHLTVSLADVGSQHGHPVFIYLGLGCVRYLVALYDELAEAMGLRLICIDRWGLGRSDSIPKAKRGFAQWAKVVEQTADLLGIESFSILAHSAGTPYALATSLQCPERVKGRIHLLAPWVNNTLDGQGTGYKLLKWVPTSVIKTAQAAEWRVHSWKLGKNPTVTHTPVGYDRWAPISSDQYTPDEEEVLDDMVTPRGKPSSLPSVESLSPSPSRPTSSRKSSKGFLGSIFRTSSPKIDRNSWLEPSSSSEPSSSTSVLSISTRPSSILSNTGSRKSPTSPNSELTARSSINRKAQFDLPTALLRASYSESMEGGTADLLAILERTGNAQEVPYSDVHLPVNIYYGSKDDRISVASVKALQNAISGSTLEVIEGADHHLLTSSSVIVRVFDQIKEDWSSL